MLADVGYDVVFGFQISGRRPFVDVPELRLLQSILLSPIEAYADRAISRPEPGHYSSSPKGCRRGERLDQCRRGVLEQSPHLLPRGYRVRQ